MLRILLVLVIVGLGLALVAKNLKQSPVQTTANEVPQMTTQEAERLKFLIEENQTNYQNQVDRVRGE